MIAESSQIPSASVGVKRFQKIDIEIVLLQLFYQSWSFEYILMLMMSVVFPRVPKFDFGLMSEKKIDSVDFTDRLYILQQFITESLISGFELYSSTETVFNPHAVGILILDDTILIFQNCLHSRLFANISHHPNLIDELNDKQFRIRNYGFH